MSWQRRCLLCYVAALWAATKGHKQGIRSFKIFLLFYGSFYSIDLECSGDYIATGKEPILTARGKAAGGAFVVGFTFF